jgi:hypothetical protein
LIAAGPDLGLGGADEGVSASIAWTLLTEIRKPAVSADKIGTTARSGSSSRRATLQ